MLPPMTPAEKTLLAMYHDAREKLGRDPDQGDAGLVLLVYSPPGMCLQFSLHEDAVGVIDPTVMLADCARACVDRSDQERQERSTIVKH